MPEIDQTPATREGAPLKEKLGYNTDFVGLRARLLMGQDMLDHTKPIPQSPEDIKKAFDQPELREKSTYRLLTNLSTDERIKYWEKRGKEENLSQTGAQKAAWKKEVVDIFNDPDSGDYRTVFAKFKTGGINWREFNDAESEKVYERYFQDSRLTPVTLDGKTNYLPSSIIQYVDDVLSQYIKPEQREDGTTQATVNFDQLQKDLSTIQAFSTIFGKQYSYEILAQLIDAEIKNIVAEKQQDEIKAALQKQKVGDTEKARGDNLRPREIELLEALQKASAYKETESKTPSSPTPQQGKPPSEPEDFEFEEVEKSKPLPTGYKWIYEKAFNPLKDKPDKIRTFPEEHLVEEMVRPTAIAHKLKVQDRQYALNRFDHLTEEHLAKEIEHENGILESRLAKLGLDRTRLVDVLNSAMGAYRGFVEEKYKLKLPEIGEIAIKPIWGKTAQYYNPDRKALAFIIPTVPAIFMDMDTIAQAALNLSHKPWQELSPEEFRTLIVRLLNEIRPHETTHLSSDLAFWYLDKETNSDKHKKVAVGKLGPFVVKPVGLNEEGDIITKQRGRGLMEAVTVELTNQWAKSLNSPLDIDAYKAERRVLNTLIKQMMEEQKIPYDQAFTKFVEAYFTPDGFSHLAQELSGRRYETTPDGKIVKTGELKKPYYLSTIYALMEYETRKTMQTGGPNYSLTLSYIHDHLTDSQRQEIMALADNPPAYLTLPFIMRKHLLEQLAGVKPPKPSQPPPPPEPPKPTTPPEPPIAPAKEVKKVEDIISETVEKLDKGESINLVMTEESAATLIPTLLPSIQQEVRKKAKGLPITLSIEGQPELKITTPQAAGKATIEINAIMMKPKLAINFTLKNARPGIIAFSEVNVEPPEVMGFNVQEILRDELVKESFNARLFPYLIQEVQKKNKDLQINSLSLEFTPENRLAIRINGSKKAEDVKVGETDMTSHIRSKEFPKDKVHLVGKEGDNLKIVVNPQILKKANEDMLQRSWQTGKFIERGGAFIGKVYKTETGELWTEIVDYHPMESEAASAGHYTITPDSWGQATQYLNKIQKESGDDSFILVAWAHSHPSGFEGMMTGADHDDFINKNFFPLDGQFAYVYGAGTGKDAPVEIKEQLTNIHSFFSKNGSGPNFGLFSRHVGIYLKI